MAKPFIVVIDPDRDTGLPEPKYPERDAFVKILREDYGCDVKVWSRYSTCRYHSDRQAAMRVRLRAWMRYPDFVLLIVGRCDVLNQHRKLIELVREVSPDFPVVVTHSFRVRDKMWEDDEGDFSTRVYRFEDSGLIQFVQDCIVRCPATQNPLGADTRAEQDLLLRQLEQVYDYHLGRLETQTVVSDHAGKTARQAMRLRMLPSSLLQYEFDKPLQRPVARLKVVQTVFESEVKRIRGLSASERLDFAHALLIAEEGGYIGGGTTPGLHELSYGDNVSGFAIDPETLQLSIRGGLGNHAMARHEIIAQLETIEGARLGRRIYSFGSIGIEIRRRIIDGLLLHRVDGFSSPILRLFTEDGPTGTPRKLRNFFLGNRKYIPVTSDGKILGD